MTLNNSQAYFREFAGHLRVCRGSIELEEYSIAGEVEEARSPKPRQRLGPVELIDSRH